MVAGFIAPAFIKKFGLKQMSFVGALLFGLVVGVQTLPAWYSEVIDNPDSVEGKWYKFLTEKHTVEIILVISSILSGMGAACIWVSQGEYISRCATPKS